MFEKVSWSLKYDSIFFCSTNIYMVTNTNHFTPLALRMRGTRWQNKQRWFAMHWLSVIGGGGHTKWILYIYEDEWCLQFWWVCVSRSGKVYGGITRKGKGYPMFLLFWVISNYTQKKVRKQLGQNIYCRVPKHEAHNRTTGALNRS